jgi:hypothetical protein
MRNRMAVRLALALLGALASGARAQEVLFESGVAPRDPDGLSFEVSDNFRPAHRFELLEPAIVTGAGGAFVAQPAGTDCDVFAAIVALAGFDDLPDGFDLSGADVVGAALLGVGDVAADSMADFGALALDPGWYMLVLGTGAFGAPACAAVNPGLAAGWADGDPEQDFLHLRVSPAFVFEHPAVVRMLVTPEPGAAAVAGAATAALVAIAGARRRRV